MLKEIPRKFIMICDGCGQTGDTDSQAVVVMEDGPVWLAVTTKQIETLQSSKGQRAVGDFCPKCAEMILTTISAVMAGRSLMRIE